MEDAMDDPEEAADPQEDLEEDDEERGLRDQLFRAKDQLTSLAEGTASQVDDSELCRDLAQQVKAYTDRLHALHRLLNPIDRLIDKRTQLTGLNDDIDAEVAHLEQLSASLDSLVDPALLKEVQAELDQVKKDRKLVADPADEPEDEPRSGSRSLGDWPVAERLARIFGRRFVSPQRLGQLMGGALEEQAIAGFDQALDQVWSLIFSTPQLLPHVAANRLKTLQRIFRDYALICRSPLLPGPGGLDPCTIENLRARFRQFFLKVPIPSLWYSKLDFFQQPLPKPHWALVDRQYLNCTFRRPGLRLLIYARANELPQRLVRQKSALEDTYDRVVMNLSQEEPFFANCNSITRTAYQLAGEASSKQVYVFYRGEKGETICISGKRGLPHWRPTRPRWPGVLPSLVFPLS
jgi:hypothetical protein